MRERASGGVKHHVAVLLLWVLATFLIGSTAEALAQVPVTPIRDTVYHADGTVASGTVLVSWGPFTTVSGQSVPQGSTSVTLGAGGIFNIALAPNAGATPIGTYYTVVYHLDDGSTSRENWVIPVSSTPLMLNAVRASVLPTTIALQTVTKQYVDQAIARAALTGVTPADGSPYVEKSGDTMTGPLVLPGSPATSLQAATKGYVDSGTAALQAGLAQKVATVPAATQIVTQPAGTQLEVSNLNGVLNARNYLSSAGSDGIANALTGPDCTTGCSVTVDQGYTGTDVFSLHNDQSHLVDHRGGAVEESFLNPQLPSDSEVDAYTITANETLTAAGFLAQGKSSTLNATALTVVQNGLTGGNNYFPQNVGGPIPYFKTTYSATSTVGNNSAEGQHVLDRHTQNCYGVGDCLIGSQFLYGSGGQRDNADEGTHPYDITVAEDSRVFQGICTTGCVTGSTQIQIAATASGATIGEGRYLIDMASGKTISTGALVGSGSPTLPHAFASFTGTSFPLSTFFTLTAPVYAQANSMTPGTLTMPIQTSGQLSGYSTNTSSVPAASGVACVADATGTSGIPSNFETVTYSVVDGNHFQVTFSRPHPTGATLAIGGLCGYGVEQTIDTVVGIRQVFPIVGTLTSTSIYYDGIASAVLGLSGSSSAYLNMQVALAGLQRSGNVVTATTSGNLPANVNGLTLAITGAADSSYNGSFVVTTSAANQFTYTQTGADSTSAGGTAGVLTGNFVMYPMAEVRSVYNPVTESLGTITLAPNTVAWSVGDPLEQPHFFQERISGDSTYVNQITPRERLDQTAGIFYGGIAGTGITGWEVGNNSPAANYYGNGGTHATPTAGFRVSGPWTTSLDMQAGEANGIRMECNSHGCGRWDSVYNLFSLQSNAGYDSVNFSPPTSTLVFNMRGTQYTMSPTGLTAPTINTTTLNVTRINGSNVAASATVDTTNAANITSGTLDPARLPAGYGGGGGSSSVCSSTVAWSAAPSFTLACADEVFHIPLNGNVTGESFTGLAAGDRLTLIFQVGGTSGYTVQWSPAVHGGFLTSSTSGTAGYTQAGKYLVQTLVVDTDGVTLLNPGAINE